MSLRKRLGTYENPPIKVLTDGSMRLVFAFTAATVGAFVMYLLINFTINLLNFVDENSGGAGGITGDSSIVLGAQIILCTLTALFMFKQNS